MTSVVGNCAAESAGTSDGCCQARQECPGIVYGVEDGLITSAGYLTRHADLVAAKSFHGLTLRELNLPPTRYMTVDFIKGATPDANQYLWLWHFVPQQDRVRPMLRAGELQSVTSLPPTFKVYACEDSPNNFCPRMGRHRRDPAAPAGRRPTTTGEGSVLYGEAAGKLIFIDYIFSSEDLAAGASWPAIPLDGAPIPPIDNVHILHFNGAEGTAGRYTVHMYFIPEETYLAWEKEPTGHRRPATVLEGERGRSLQPAGSTSACQVGRGAGRRGSAARDQDGCPGRTRQSL